MVHLWSNINRKKLNENWPAAKALAGKQENYEEI
jgi:hypothetical protein